jgi:hypothetical protein
MTEWGMGLLCAYVVLGVTGRLTWRQAGYAAFVLTVIVIAAVMVGYSKSTPIDEYIPSLDATVYATGNPYDTKGSLPSTENLAGVSSATWLTTDHNYAPPGGGSGG